MTENAPLMRVVALCPSFRRPKLAGNAAACFAAQDYSGPRKLLIWEDGGALLASESEVIEVVTSNRFPDLGSKYNALAERAIREKKADVLVVWEDDDIYLPWHLSVHVRALQETGRMWSKPSRVLSLYTGRLQEEPAAGRFHASIALRREAWEEVRWPTSGRADFDQQFMASLGRRFGPPADPLEIHPVPGYVFRFGSTGSWHAQHFMCGPSDTSWYRTLEQHVERTSPRPMTIMFDPETENVYQLFTRDRWGILPGRSRSLIG
jgi:hypothetical protein